MKRYTTPSRSRLGLESLEDRLAPATFIVTNTNNGGLGSLRAAILNANATGPTDTIAFNIPGLGTHTINVVSALPVLSRAVVIDGTTQPDNNPGLLGTGGTVGVGADGVAGTGDEPVLPRVNTPEIEIRGTSAIDFGLAIRSNNVSVRGLAILGFGRANIAIIPNGGRALVRGNNAAIEQNVLGTTATSFTDPGAALHSEANILVLEEGTNGALIRNNLIGFASGPGIDLLARGTNNFDILGNEIRSNGLGGQINGAGIAVAVGGQNPANNHTVSGNLIVDNRSYGIDLYRSNNSVVAQNTITGNGAGGLGTAGVRVGNPNTGGGGSSNDSVTRNIITANTGAGVLVAANSAGNPISQNSIFANGTIGIDLLTASDDQNTGTPPYVTLNDPGDIDSGGNDLLNFPVLTSVTIIGTDLVIEGTVRRGATIEFFISDSDPSGFGEGQTYLATRTEGSGRDASTGNSFRFVIPLAALAAPVAVGTVITSTATLPRPTDALRETSEFSGNIAVVPGQTTPVADLAVTKVAGPRLVAVGQTVTFTITVRNLGPDLATNVVVTDLLRPWLAFVSAQPSQGTYNPATGVWNVIALTPGGSATLRLTARVTTTGTFRNTASVTFTGDDPDPSNNAAAAAVAAVFQPPEVVLSKRLLLLSNFR